MLTMRQVWRLMGLGLLFWLLATAGVHWTQGAIVDPLRGGLMFATAVPVGWLSVLLTRKVAQLSRGRLTAGVAFAGATAMLIDGMALRWAPEVYGQSDLVVRLAAAWLLWGYGIAFLFALAIDADLIRSRNSAASGP